MKKSKVLFTSKISSLDLLRIYQELNKKLPSKVAVKVHSGEKGNKNFLKPELMIDIVNFVDGTIVECNTAYEGFRNTSEKHLLTIKEHGWNKYFKVDLLDQDGDISFKLKKSYHLKENYVGKNIVNYSSLLVISHFKGHPMGGYGGALKNISIGLASSYGKAVIHGASDPDKIWTANHDDFIESMADASKTIMDYFKNNVVFINIMANMSIDCDCCSNAKNPEISDIGILASTDPVALDQACLDLIYSLDDPKKKSLIERIENLNGKHILDASVNLEVGFKEYELINID